MSKLLGVVASECGVPAIYGVVPNGVTAEVVTHGGNLVERLLRKVEVAIAKRGPDNQLPLLGRQWDRTQLIIRTGIPNPITHTHNILQHGYQLKGSSTTTRGPINDGRYSLNSMAT